MFDEICGDFGKLEDRPPEGERIRFPLLLLLRMLQILQRLLRAIVYYTREIFIIFIIKIYNNCALHYSIKEYKKRSNDFQRA